MAYRLPANLHRNRHGTLYFRLTIPADLKHLFEQRELYRSLNTARVREAADKAQALRIAFRAAFNDLRSLSCMTDQEKPASVDLARLQELTRHTKAKLALIDKIERLEADLAEAATERTQAHKQHRRELAIAIAAKGAGAPPAKPKGGKTISQAWEGYKAEKIAAKAWRDGEDTAKYDHWPHIRTLIGVIGDKPLVEVTADDINKFQTHVLNDPEGGSPRNRDKRLSRAGAVLRWAKKKRLISDDFTELFRYPGKIEQNSYAAFDACELKALFESESYKNGTFKTPSEYWLPILALHTGARLNELCQLSVTDIGTHDGIETISILAGEEGKRLKNKASERIIPIHSKLIELGLLDYVASIKTGRIFPELPEDSARPGNYGAKPSEKFTDYRRECGVGALSGRSNKSIHSFRSTFISALRKAGVPKDRRTRLAGHEYDDTQDKTYHGGDVLTMFDFKTLKADIERVRFDVEFTPFEATTK